MLKKTIPLVLVVLTVGWVFACSSSASGEFSPAAREEIRKAREISITVAVEPRGLVPLQMSVHKVLERIFAGLGLAVASGPGAFPVFEVRIRCDAIGKDYWVDQGYPVTSFAGARLKGEMALAQTDRDELKRSFSGRQDPPKNIFAAIEDPLDAPFDAALQQSDFLPAIAGLVDSCWGRDKALAVIAGMYEEILPLRLWRLAVLRSLELFGDDNATAALRGILVRHAESLADPSADTAFDDCLVRLLEILVARNDRASRPAVVLLGGKLQAYVHYGVWGDSSRYLQATASRLR